jgi:hypothetical protein
VSSTGKKGRARFTVTCSSACSGLAKLTVSKKTAKQLGLGRKRAAGSSRFAVADGRHPLTVRLSSKVRSAMKRHHVKRVTVGVSIRVRDTDERGTVASRSVKLRA